MKGLQDFAYSILNAREKEMHHITRMEPSDLQLQDDLNEAFLFDTHCRIANREVLIAMIVSESRRTMADCRFIFDDDYNAGLTAW